ncbi:NAD(P)-binding domain-containing protein [Rozella allomycis CSF55]|uniref:NAD(P)-binding domain-containing protein n=1 Tax=Rozella allomycis (strain CSF55) TaxID=988480 RepID=A0A075ATF5_ROZAC|nr:NAD(P)-binding domain-containing protein [Rozella allomycis CSF55]|eukprot:EPZ33533.1 NAD(P)-binding domain-containing protein [Rozella allomycis CSF55]
MRLAVVGSGPAAFYCIQRLIKKAKFPIHIDMFERHPLPFGLACMSKFIEIGKSLKNFYGNVLIGDLRKPLSHQTHIPLKRLCERYNSILLASGATGANKLHIHGSEHIVTSVDFVALYNTEPNDKNNVELIQKISKIKHVTIIGNDIARMLLKPKSELENTDINKGFLENLSNSINTVLIIGRKSIYDVQFTAKEIREITNINDVQIKLNKREIYPEPSVLSKSKKRVVDLLLSSASDASNIKKKTLEFKFMRVPKCVHKMNEHLTMSVGKYRNQNDILVPSGEHEHIETDLIISSIGYAQENIDTLIENSKITHPTGKLLTNDSHCMLYSAGWAKRGPSGVLASTMMDANITADAILEDMDKQLDHESKHDMLPINNYVNWESAIRIHRKEIENGAKYSRSEILSLANTINI